MVNQVKIVKQACRKEQAQHLQWVAGVEGSVSCHKDSVFN